MDEVLRWATLAANVAQVIAVVFLIKQISVANRQTKLAQSSLEVGSGQMRVAQATLEETRAERVRQEADRRASIQASVRAEIEAIGTAAELDVELFNPSDLSNPRVMDARHDQQIEGEVGYHRSFVWTPLPTSVVEQGIHEASLLNLIPDQIEALQDLRLRILKANALVAGKTAALPTLLQGGVQREFQLSYYRWIDMKVDNIDRSIMMEFKDIISLCTRIAEWLG